MKNNTKYYILGAGLIIAVLIGFGGNSNRDLASNQFGGTHNTVGNSPVENAPVGDFTLKKLDGSDLTLSSYQGDKPVILDFWASWCPNCKRDMPILSGFYDKYKDQVEVIGVNLQESGSTAKRFVEGAGISFPIVLDPDGTAARMFGVRFTNYHVLINTDGTLAGTIPGDIAEQHILALIENQPKAPEIEIIGDGNLEVEIIE